ncbi:MAG: adenylate/guanylate cyclase domain-containing protein [Halioglobus sp.]
MASSSNVTTWLERIGLAKYAPSFAEHEIDLEILPELSDADLKDIGLPLGPRRKVQSALAEQQRQPALPNSPDVAERRHLTVMFADLVGSSEMSAKMDPEDLRDVMLGFQDVSKQAVEKFQGFVARYMGDGILAYFGYPQANEHDPERSVRAGLELVRMTASLNARLGLKKGVSLSVRVGIATGPVVVGDLIGEAASAERSVVGETPNIAARIQAAAPVNGVLIGQNTFKLLGDQFESEALGARELKGFAKPMQLYQIRSARHIESRFKATRSNAQVRFVGREKELEKLQESWSLACESNGGGRLLSGEAGVGKSRFLQEFLNRVASAAPITIHYQCSPFHTNTAFYPITEHFTARAQLQQGDSAAIIREKLASTIRTTSRPYEESLQLFASLLSVDIGGTPLPKLTGDPARLLTSIHKMLVEQILAASESGPVLLIFEDVHWMDPTSADLVVRLARACGGQRVLMLVTSRPHGVVEQTIGAALQSIELEGLSEEETETLVRSVPKGSSLTPSALRAVVERTDGIPLFIEELTKLVLERENTESGSGESIPNTLVDSLTERLDRLGSAKELAQIGATIGREFSHALMIRIDKRSEDIQQEDIERLIAADLVQRISSQDGPAYRFKHALVQDAAYATLLHATRREHHSKIADAILEDFSNTARNSPELLAHHLSQAARPSEAVEYWQLAGTLATNRSANTEAINHLSRGITALHSMPSVDSDQLRKELELQIALGAPLVAARGYASEELSSAYSRALEIGSQLDGGIANFRVLWGLSSFYLVRGQLPKAMSLQLECLNLAERDNNSGDIIQATSWLGTILFYRSEYQEAASLLHRGLELYERDFSHRDSNRYGLDPAVLARVHLAWLYWLTGKTQEALTLDEETLSFAEGLNHPLSYAHALIFSVVLHFFHGNYTAALSAADRLLTLSRKREYPHYVAYAECMRGALRATLGSVEQGIEEMKAGLKARRDTGAELVRPMLLTLQANILATAGLYAQSLEALDEADEIVALNGEHWHESETKRIRGIALHKQLPASDKALEHLTEAVECSRDVGAKSFEIRALTSLIELQRERSDSEAEQRQSCQRLSTLLSEIPQDDSSIDYCRSRDLLSSQGVG